MPPWLGHALPAIVAVMAKNPASRIRPAAAKAAVDPVTSPADQSAGDSAPATAEADAADAPAPAAAPSIGEADQLPPSDEPPPAASAGEVDGAASLTEEPGEISDIRVGDRPLDAFPASGDAAEHPVPLLSLEHPELEEPIRVVKAPALPEIVLHNELPIGVDVRWLDDGAGLLVTLSLLPGFDIVGPHNPDAVLLSAPAVTAEEPPLPVLDPAELLAWRELDEPGVVSAVTRDGRKVKGILA